VVMMLSKKHTKTAQLKWQKNLNLKRNKLRKHTHEQ